MTTKPSRLSYTASLVSQGKHRFYTLTMPSDVLARTSYIISRDEDPQEGFQRLLNKERAQQIADYIDAGLGTIPTSIILSAQSIADLDYTNKNKTLSFNLNPKSFLILDGQHRVYGFSLAKSELRVPVVIYNNLTRIEESRLFIDINTKQKPVPTELLLDIRKLADYQDDMETRLGEIFDLFDTEPSSPLLGVMSPIKRKKDHVSRVTFNAAVKTVISLFGEADTKDIYKILAAYFGAIISVSKANNIQMNISANTVFRAMIIIFPDIVQRVRDKFGPVYTVDNFSKIISEMFKKMKSSTIKNATGTPAAYAKLFIDALKPTSIL